VSSPDNLVSASRFFNLRLSRSEMGAEGLLADEVGAGDSVGGAASDYFNEDAMGMGQQRVQTVERIEEHQVIPGLYRGFNGCNQYAVGPRQESSASTLPGRGHAGKSIATKKAETSQVTMFPLNF